MPFRSCIPTGNHHKMRLMWISIVALLVAACGKIDSSAPQGPKDTGADQVNYVWSSVTIGSGDPLAETQLREDGSIELAASGRDIWGQADELRFAYTEIGASGSLTAMVNQVSIADPWSKFGVMVREDTNAGARNAFMHITEGGGAQLQSRKDRHGETLNQMYEGTTMQAREAGFPAWVRITREGQYLTGHYSEDGVTWHDLGSVEVDLPEVALIGFAVSSGRSGSRASGIFSGIDLTVEGGSQPTPPSPQPPAEPRPVDDDSYEVSYEFDYDTPILNPERGFHLEVGLMSGNSFSNARDAGFTLVRSTVRLDDYRNQRIPESLLNDLQVGLDRVRTAGVKILLRFAYNHGGSDAPLDYVLMHIQQLQPILHENVDVIAGLQAGFIGAWGEWHNSTNGLLSEGPKRQIANALLEALPASRMIQIRTPSHIRSLVGPAAQPTDWFGSSAKARTGFMNDCFVSTENDAGTFGGADDRAEAALLSQYTLIGGETCLVGYPNERNRCEVALQELAQYHFDYLNGSEHTSVVERWRSEGCFDEVARRLGYRLGLTRAVLPYSVAPGQQLSVSLTITNAGFGKVYNPRPIDIVLRNSSTRQEYNLRASSDIRTEFPLAGETREVDLRVMVPTSLPLGEYEVLLRLPDAASSISQDARYSVRLANRGMWEESSGSNNLGVTLQVSNLGVNIQKGAEERFHTGRSPATTESFTGQNV